MKKIIKNPSGWKAINFRSDSLGRKFVEIAYSKIINRVDVRRAIPKNLRRVKYRRINLPKNVKINRIENNSPKIGYITITYQKYTGLGKSGYGKVLKRKKGESIRSLAKRQTKEFGK